MSSAPKRISKKMRKDAIGWERVELHEVEAVEKALAFEALGDSPVIIEAGQFEEEVS